MGWSQKKSLGAFTVGMFDFWHKLNFTSSVESYGKLWIEKESLWSLQCYFKVPAKYLGTGVVSQILDGLTIMLRAAGFGLMISAPKINIISNGVVFKAELTIKNI